MRKRAKYDKDFKESESHIFGTLAWETFAAINRSLAAPAHAAREEEGRR